MSIVVYHKDTQGHNFTQQKYHPMPSFYRWREGVCCCWLYFQDNLGGDLHISHVLSSMEDPPPHLLKNILISKPSSLTLTSPSTHYNSQTLIKFPSTLEDALLSPSCHTVSSRNAGGKCFNFPSYLV